MMDRCGQSWSIDVVLGVVIFGFVAVTFSSFMLLDRPDIDDLQIGAERVSLALEDSPNCGTVLANNTIVNESLSCLYAQDYESLRESLRLRGDFCVYLEDDMGRLIRINSSDNLTRNGWGSSELIVGGQPCGN